jgi:lactoylglutathione lyase
MRIDHIAVWTGDLERLKEFFITYFHATVGPKYTNPAKGFESYFLSFDGGTRLEIMRSSTLTPVAFEPGVQRMGLTHFAVSVGSDEAVNQLTQRLRSDGYPVIDGPRRTGDGYYESVVLDPDGNRIEITA